MDFDRLLAYATRLGPRHQRTPGGILALCPGHDDHEPSLHISPHRQDPERVVVHCFAGCKFEHLRAILQAYDIPVGGAPRPAAPPRPPARDPKGPGGTPEEWRWAGAHPAPDDVQLGHRTLGAPERVWTYRTAHGDVHAWIARYREPDGTPTRRPWSFWTRGSSEPVVRCAMPPSERRLPYALDALAAHPRAPVIICEGEGTAEAGQALFPDTVVTTWMGGAQALDRTDWRPLRRRRVAFIPDDDPPGLFAASEAMTTLAGIASVAVWIDPGALPGFDGPRGTGRDIEDAHADGLTPETVRQWRTTLPRAHPLHLPREKTPR